MKLLAVFTTVSTRDEARRMAASLVERQLAACAQISEIESFYCWQGKVQHDPECRLMLKTTAERYPALEAAIRAMHAYELPAIYAVAAEQAFEPYAQWVADATSGSEPG